MVRITFLMVLPLLIRSAAVVAEVTDAADGGFALKHTVTVNAAPEKAFATFVDVGTWWSSAHTYSGDAANMSMQTTPGGAFIEKLANNGFVRHMEIVYCAPGEAIRLQGGLGPLQEHAVQGSMTVKFEGHEDSTTIVVTYNVGGYVEGGIKNWAAPVDQVLGEQFDRLKKRIQGTLTDGK